MYICLLAIVILLAFMKLANLCGIYFSQFLYCSHFIVLTKSVTFVKSTVLTLAKHLFLNTE